MFNTLPSNAVSQGVGGVAQVKLVSGSGNWAFPNDMVGDFVNVTLIAAGAGGTSHGAAGNGGGGGGGGEVIYRVPFFVDRTNNSSLPFSVGAGGVGRDFSGPADGDDGGDTTFGSLTAAGGVGGVGGAGEGGAGGGNTGGAAPASDVAGNDGTSELIGEHIMRMGGSSGGSGANTGTAGNDAGNSIFANGGTVTSPDDAGGGGASMGRGGITGSTGTQLPLLGGGGGGSNFDDSLDSQAGANGQLIIEYQT